ncbi:MAG: amidohydrolase family protein [Promethearchaeota archaeon]
MLVVKDEGGKRHSFWVVDGHTHIGSEEVIEYGRRSYRKNSPRQILDFYKQTKFELLRHWRRNPGEFSMELVDEFVRPSPFFGAFSRSVFGNRYEGWFVDQFVSFPFNDAHRKDSTPEFRVPNDMILKRMHEPAFSGRLLGYCRVNPFDGELAVAEVERCVGLGIRGLKLHPISQKFLDQVTEKPVGDVVTAALNGRIPVIFDCRFVSTAEDIYELYQEIKADVRNPDHGIILAHSGMDFAPSSLYEILGDPHMYGDTSGMRSDDVSFFFKRAHEESPDAWFENIVFGTDYNYFTAPQALDLISYLFSRDMYERTEVTAAQIQRILAGNLLGLIYPGVATGAVPGGRTVSSEEARPVTLEVVQRCTMDWGALEVVVDRLGERFGTLAKKKKLRVSSVDPFLDGESCGILPWSFLLGIEVPAKGTPKTLFISTATTGGGESGDGGVVDIFGGGREGEGDPGGVREGSGGGDLGWGAGASDRLVVVVGLARDFPDVPELNPRKIVPGSPFHDVVSAVDPAGVVVVEGDGLEEFLSSIEAAIVE